MSTAGAHPKIYTAQAVASMSPQTLAQLLQTKAATIADLRHQIELHCRTAYVKQCRCPELILPRAPTPQRRADFA